jgi:5-amino-6-(5-phosphoribosylamino)uracil reductase
LYELRASSQALVQGRHTVMDYDHIGVLKSADFQKRLQDHGHAKPFTYVVVSAHPDELLFQKINPEGGPLRVVLATTDTAPLPQEIPQGIEIWRGGGELVDLKHLQERLAGEGFNQVTLEAGPQLFGAWVAAGLVDELYVTIAPKIFGTSGVGTPTMINGVLFEPSKIPQLKLLSVRADGQECFLRYEFIKAANGTAANPY